MNAHNPSIAENTHVAHNPNWHPALQQDNLADSAARLSAINPHFSYIVQAPAGSGKTALLTQRFLALLARVETPEQIVAMTFTKKAAAEMRERVLHAIKQGLNPTCDSDKVYDQNTWRLARDVVQRDRDQAWCLLDNPNRLRIRTIDSMNGYLVQQMPFLSKLGTQPSLQQNSDALYVEAARAVLASEAVQTESAALLRLVNGRYRRAENQLVSMLKKRDQWMRILLGGAQREQLESALEALVLQQAQQAIMQLGPVIELGEELPELARFVLGNKPDVPLQSLAQADWPLGFELEDLGAWRELAGFVLTQKGELRKKVDARSGFPAGDKAPKEKMQGLLAELANRLSDASVSGLADLMTLPDPIYTDLQWQDLAHLIRLLTHAVAHLKLAFKSAGETDFIEVAQAASEALGDDEAPTDLALQLDYQIQHLLIDEFQDTSVGQFDLVKKLVRGWMPGDGRSLFIVGDPMQSIYRFREAEVGNFLQVWTNQALAFTLTPLNLTVNFRSNAALVNWYNQTFAKVFPKQDDLVLGAVSYAPAQPSPQAQEQEQAQAQAKAQSSADALENQTAMHSAIQTHWAVNQTDAAQAQQMAEIIQHRMSELAEDDGAGRIAVLGRSRSHLAPLAYQLKQQGIAFRAVELEGLNQRQEIQDCLALTRALLHGSDRGAWIALLRAPFIGLSLVDLYALLGADKSKLYAPVTACLADDQAWLNCTAEGQARLAQAWPLLQSAMALIGSQPFSRVVHQAWWQLAAAQTLDSEVELDNVQVFFEGLAQWDQSPEPLDSQQLDNWVQTLYAGGDSRPEAQKVQLMTMHKSKGLQFDTVFLPSLAKQPRHNERALVSWLEFASEQGEGLVLAPLDQTGQSGALNKLIAKVEQQKQQFEDGRLFYVAATRAENQLHLFASLNLSSSQAARTLNTDTRIQPPSTSLLAPLWRQVAGEFLPLIDQEIERLAAMPASAIDSPMSAAMIKYLPYQTHKPEDWRSQTPQPLPAVKASKAKATRQLDESAESNQQTPRDYQAGLVAQRVGDLVHALLEQIAHIGIAHWRQPPNAQCRAIYRSWLSEQGVPAAALNQAVGRVEHSMRNALAHPRLRWALQNDHAEAACELALTAKFEQIENHIVDRTFIDETGTRWIIDYKTSVQQTHDATDQASYLASLISHYRPQLARYGALFNQIEQRAQKWVLYFTELDKWVELD
ncbi:UvrD-helicase domain-containing protein [Thiomicrospira microaerophila]|uniref:UvrD-helicase domain-containing protein n=1 Tax=Thiomicrospira microaerophila TaxID=406020 RepID=UPI0005C9B9C9|nr:UvrD-helicase domain-containing protein [Thiomicrospira microaerophila]